jgi:hypothetical protein
LAVKVTTWPGLTTPFESSVIEMIPGWTIVLPVRESEPYVAVISSGVACVTPPVTLRSHAPMEKLA